MRRRASSLWRSNLDNIIMQFEPGDIVHALITSGDSTFYGVIRDVNAVENKVYVAWNNGAVTQHDPDEVELSLFVDEQTRRRLQQRVENGVASPKSKETLLTASACKPRRMRA